MQKPQWNEHTVLAHFNLPFVALIHKAYSIHTQHFDAKDIEYCTLSSIKTGSCPEDCAYCPQSAHYNTGLKKEKLLDLDTIIAQAKSAKANGAKRFCMGAAWRSPPKKGLPKVTEVIKVVKALGLETCASLGLLDKEQAQALKSAGLDYYNHNLDSSKKFYETIITTRNYQQRLDTLQHVMDADINVCCGGILGMGESRDDRVKLLLTLYELPKPINSIPINTLIPIPGTPLAKRAAFDHFELIKTLAITRLMFPTARIRLAAGRLSLTDSVQAWCFMAGANSIFIGEKLLTATNPSLDKDSRLLNTLGFNPPNAFIEKTLC